MLSPKPLPLLFALLLCLPLALVFTITITTPKPTIATTFSPPPQTVDNKRDQLLIGCQSCLTPTNSTSARLPPLPPSTPSINDDQLLIQITSKTNPAPTNFTTTTTFPPPPLPPPIKVDYSDDQLLFQIASTMNPTTKPNTPKKLAFVFLTTSSLPFSPLWQLYFNKTPTDLYNIYIHAHPSLSPLNFSGVFSDRYIPSKPTRRFTPTLASAARRLLAHALIDDPSNSHFALLSASCIPLHSFNFTYKIVISSPKSFVEVLDHEGGAFNRWAARGKEIMLPEVEFKDFRIGSQFWVMTRKHAKMVVSDTRTWEKFKLPCLRQDTCYPEENYFPTLLNMIVPREIVPATLTHVDWTGRHDGHPRTYGPGDVGKELIKRLRSERPRYGDEKINKSDSSVIKKRSDPFLFARKFSQRAVKQLMSIANEVILKD